MSTQKKTKLTKPQQELKDRFDKGERILSVNTHHLNGGHYVWVKADGYVTDELCRYKTFWNLIAALHGWQKPYPKENYFAPQSRELSK